jgi:hypothetical protein
MEFKLMENPYTSSMHSPSLRRPENANAFMKNALMAAMVATVLTNFFASTIRVWPLTSGEKYSEIAVEWAFTFFWNCFDIGLMLLFLGACVYKLQQWIPVMRSAVTVCAVVAVVSYSLGVPKVFAKGLRDSTWSFNGFVCAFIGVVVAWLVYSAIQNQERTKGTQLDS